MATTPIAAPTFDNHGEQDGVVYLPEHIAHTQEEFVKQASTGTIDKSKWPRGPWDDEPNRLEFIWRGLPCSVVRHPNYGSLMAYVGVPEGHPWTTQRIDDVQVHGGLTYWNGPTDRIRWSKPLDGCSWFGFDCNHAEDYAPGLALLSGNPTLEYRTLEFVANEVRFLADQAVRAGGRDMKLLFPNPPLHTHECQLCKTKFFTPQATYITGTVSLKEVSLSLSYCANCAPKVTDALFQLGFLQNVIVK